MGNLEHSCGVIGLSLDTKVAPFAKKALRVIQHRGQESAGVAIFNDGHISYLRDMGLVHEVLRGSEYYNLTGNVCIGHVRYSTEGESKASNCQPMTVTTSYGDIALAHNGDITNATELREQLSKKGWAFLTTSDTEIIIRILAKEFNETRDPIKAIKNTLRMIEGAYSLTMLIGDRLFGIRDPMGFRPLCIGRLKEGNVVVSESAALDVTGGEFIRDVLPGEIIEVTRTSFHSVRTPAPKNPAHCMFEWVYFARPDSIMECREAYEVRKRIGQILASEHPIDADVVVPVPDSGRAHAIGYAEGSGIKYEEGFMKNRYVERTFIMPVQKQREAGVMLKLNPIRSTVKGRRLVVVDDSIVRGTTLRKLVQMLRRAGAEEVHVRIGCPPIVAPCFYGVDMKTRGQFVATGRTVDEIAEHITADSLGYISIDGLVKALNIPYQDLCLACLNGEYPTPIPGERQRFQTRLNEHGQ